MIGLLSKSDKDVISGAGFVKNAVFYKDMLAFYDAYEKLMQTKKDKLPSFCYKNGTFYLEGICLLFKDYSSELGFESVKLSLDYLKVLYYTIASYSEDENLPDKKLIIDEFNVYKNASTELAVSSSIEKAKAQEEFNKVKEDFDKTSANYAKKLVSARITDGFSVVWLIFTFICTCIPCMFYYYGNLALVTAIIISASIVVSGIIIYSIIKYLAKKRQTDSGDLSYEIQSKKKKKDVVELELANAFDKFNKINSEKYEYNSSFASELQKYTKTISFADIINRANDYKMLSYNMKLDLEGLYASQEDEIKEYINMINSITNPETSESDFEKIYNEICEKDWLYFNNEIRFEFIKRMADVSEFTFNYTVIHNGKKVNPFGISVKSLAKEKIVYLRSNEDLFISASLDKFLNTKYIKNTKTLELKGIRGSDALKRAKMEFASHFFDYDGTVKYNNLFYETKIQDGVKIPQEIIEQNRKVPTFVYMKLKLIENRMGLGNSDAPTIKQLSKIVAAYEASGDFVRMQTVDMTEEPETSVAAETAIYEDLGYAVKYTFEDGSFIGYRIPTIV